MRFLAEAAFESVVRHLLARAGLPLRLLGSALFVFGVGVLFIVMGLVAVLVAFDAPAPTAAPLTIAIGGIALMFGVASALAGIAVLLGARWTNRLGLIVSATGGAWFVVGAAVSALSGDTGSAIASAVVAGIYGLALRVFYREHHMI